MKNNILKMILFISLFLAMFSFEVHADLILSNNSTSPSGSVSYSPNQPYKFNITLQNTSFPVYIVLFEWNGANETPTGNRTIDANTTEFYMNIVDLPANETGWSYKWFVSDTDGETNYTQNAYVINKYDTVINLFLNDNETDKNYSLNQNANFTALLNVPEKIITLSSNMTGFATITSITSNITNITNLNTIGLFYINASFDGDQNYSANSSMHYFGVLPYWVSNATLPTSASTYSAGKNYSFMIKWIGSVSNINFESNFNGTPINYTNITNYTNGNYWINFTDLPAGSYLYRWYANDAYGNNVKTDQWNYFISQISLSLYWSSPTLSPPWTVNAGTTTTVTCNSGNPINLTLNVNSVNIVSKSLGSVSDSPSSSTVAIYTYNCYPTDTVNYSANIQGTLTFQSTSGTTTPTPAPAPTTSTNFLIKGLTSSLSMDAGESKPITFQLSNGLSNNLLNVSVSVSGIDSSWYTLSKNIISNLIHGSSETITLTLNIPTSADAKTYGVTITAKGTVLGSTTVKTATDTMNLIVNSSTQNVIAPSLGNNANTTSSETQNTTSEQPAGPTGLVSIFEYMRNNLLIIVAIAACILIFIFRDDVSENLMRITGKKGYKKYYKTVDFSSLKNKLPDFEKIKNSVRDLRPEKPGIKRPEALEREIKRDIKELQNVIETDKKLNKKKKFNIENN